MVTARILRDYYTREVYEINKVDDLEILRLWAIKYSNNRISISVHGSHHTVEDVIAAAAAVGIAENMHG